MAGVLIPLGIVLLLAAGGYAIYDRITDTVDEVTAQADAELRATVKLLYERAAEGDTELFGAMLSGRDRKWSAAQQWMMGGDGLLDRSVFGLTLVEKVPDVLTIDLSPGLDSAEITTTVHYQNQLSETIDFTLPLVFRQGNSLWLYAPPNDEYWGEQLSAVEMAQFEVSYFEQDEVLIQRLVSDLNDGYRNLCDNNPALCSVQRPIFSLSFTPDPTTLYTGTWLDAEYKEQERVGAPIELPTPTIVGLPTNEASYQALLYGYAEHIFNPAVPRMAQYSCCAHQTYADAFVDRMMIDAGLKQETLSAETHASLFNTAVNFEDPAGWRLSTLTEPLESLSAESQLIVPTIARYLSHELEIDLAAGLESLLRRTAFYNWANELLNDDVLVHLKLDAQGNSNDRYRTINALRSSYGHYLAVKSNLIQPRTAASPPIPYPSAVVGLSCQRADNGEFVRWDVTTNQFETIYSVASMTVGWSLYHPPSRGFVFEQRPQFSADGANISINLLNQSGIITLPQRGMHLAGLIDNNDQYILLGELNAQGAYRDMIAVNPLQCDNDNCPLLQFEGRPIFSPDKSKYLTTSRQSPYQISVFNNDHQLLFEKPTGQQTGWNVFWVSDSSFGYQEGFSGPLLEINVDSGSETILLDIAVIFEQLGQPEEDDATERWINYWNNPDRPRDIHMSIQQTSLADSEQTALIYNLDTQTIDFVGDNLSSVSAFSDNSQYLIGWENVFNFTSRVVIIDRETQQRIPLSVHSTGFPMELGDGWLLQASGAYALLVAPAEDYYEFVELPAGMNCQFATKYPD